MIYLNIITERDSLNMIFHSQTMLKYKLISMIMLVEIMISIINQNIDDLAGI